MKHCILLDQDNLPFIFSWYWNEKKDLEHIPNHVLMIHVCSKLPLNKIIYTNQTY